MSATDPPCSVLWLYSDAYFWTNEASEKTRSSLWILDETGIRFNLIDETMKKVKANIREYGRPEDTRVERFITADVSFEGSFSDQ